eukprot:XP_013981702.1 PREDICTED: AT-rich interactive domain-containing protein 4B-like isoform X23 [Salmo salar]
MPEAAPEGAAVESISAAVADGLNGNVVPPSSPPKAQGFGILKKLTFSVELVVTISLLLSWITAGFMMFDVVEYKGVTDIQDVVLDPMKAVNDAVEGMSNMFYEAQECAFAPHLSLDHMNAVKDVKDLFVDFLSDDDGIRMPNGNFYLSYVDPVIIGRGVFNVTNNSICGVVGYIQGTLCVLLDAILDILQALLHAVSINAVDIVHVITDCTSSTGTYIWDLLPGIPQEVNVDPILVLRRMFGIVIEQKNMLVDYVSNLLIGDQGVLPEMDFDPMKVVTDAVLEIADGKNMFMDYLSNMLMDDKDEPSTIPASVMHVIRKKGQFLPPLEKVAELIGTTKDGDPTPEISITPVVAEKDDDVKEAEEEQGDNDSTDDSSEGVKKYTTPKNVWIQKQMLRVMGSKAHLRAGEVLPKDMDEDQQDCDVEELDHEQTMDDEEIMDVSKDGGKEEEVKEEKDHHLELDEEEEGDTHEVDVKDQGVEDEGIYNENSSEGAMTYTTKINVQIQKTMLRKVESRANIEVGDEHHEYDGEEEAEEDIDDEYKHDDHSDIDTKDQVVVDDDHEEDEADEDNHDTDYLDVKDQEVEHGEDIDDEDSSERTKTYATKINVWIQKQMVRKVGSRANIEVGDEHYEDDGEEEEEEAEEDIDENKHDDHSDLDIKDQVVGDDDHEEDEADEDNHYTDYLDVKDQEVEDGEDIDDEDSSEGTKTFATKRNVLIQKQMVRKVGSRANIEVGDEHHEDDGEEEEEEEAEEDIDDENKNDDHSDLDIKDQVVSEGDQEEYEADKDNHDTDDLDVKDQEVGNGEDIDDEDSSAGAKTYTTKINVRIQKQTVRKVGSRAHLRAGEVLPEDMDKDQQVLRQSKERQAREEVVEEVEVVLKAMRDAQTMKEVENKKLEDKTEKKEEQAVEKAKPEAMPSVKKAEKTGPKEEEPKKKTAREEKEMKKETKPLKKKVIHDFFNKNVVVELKKKVDKKVKETKKDVESTLWKSDDESKNPVKVVKTEESTMKKEHIDVNKEGKKKPVKEVKEEKTAKLPDKKVKVKKTELEVLKEDAKLVAVKKEPNEAKEQAKPEPTKKEAEVPKEKTKAATSKKDTGAKEQAKLPPAKKDAAVIKEKGKSAPSEKEAEFTNKKTKPAIAKKERNGPILEMNCVSSPMIVLEAEIHKEKAKAASSKKESKETKEQVKPEPAKKVPKEENIKSTPVKKELVAPLGKARPNIGIKEPEVNRRNHSHINASLTKERVKVVLVKNEPALKEKAMPAPAKKEREAPNPKAKPVSHKKEPEGVKEMDKPDPLKKEPEATKKKAKPATVTKVVSKETAKHVPVKTDTPKEKDKPVAVKKVPKEENIKSTPVKKELVAPLGKARPNIGIKEPEVNRRNHSHINASLTKERVKVVLVKNEPALKEKAMPAPAKKEREAPNPKAKPVSHKKEPEGVKEMDKPDPLKKEPEATKKKANPATVTKEPDAPKEKVRPVKNAEPESKETKETPARKEKSVEKKPAKEEKAKAEPVITDPFATEDEMPYFQCFFVDEDEAQYPFYPFSPLQM